MEKNRRQYGLINSQNCDLKIENDRLKNENVHLKRSVVFLKETFNEGKKEIISMGKQISELE